MRHALPLDTSRHTYARRADEERVCASDGFKDLVMRFEKTESEQDPTGGEGLAAVLSLRRWLSTPLRKS